MNIKQQALDYHFGSKPGKISIHPHKPLATQKDLSLAYTPGVAEPVKAIAKNHDDAYKYTSKGNLVAVITDGSAVLGLGNVGAIAAKPVMEGKAALFKKFTDIDVFDIEVNTQDVDEFVKTVINIAPTFGGINLEDISAPRCFEIEKKLIKALNIPVFHDDQHGTAIIIAAGLLNALKIQQKTIDKIKLVCLGAGSAGIATINLLRKLGLKKENILLVDKCGVIRDNMNLDKYKMDYSTNKNVYTLSDAMIDADVLIGVAAANLVSQKMIKSMAIKPIVFALSNPDPEISPKDALSAREDIIIATGRSDYPNQINNVLGFPFIFKGALAAKAKVINTAMKIAAVKALSRLAEESIPKIIHELYSGEELTFGKNYIIPKPFDPRLNARISTAVRDAAISSKVSNI